MTELNEVLLDTKASSSKKPNKNFLFFFILLTGTLVFLLSFLVIYSKLGTTKTVPRTPSIKQSFKIEKFKSDEEFKNYAAESSRSLAGLFGEAFFATDMLRLDISESTGVPGGAFGSPALESAVPERISTTNVQVAGVDEPDIVKTNGKQIYYSQQSPILYSLPVLEERTGRFLPTNLSQTQILQAFPPDELSKASVISSSGQLLLSNNILVIYDNNKITAFNVTDAKNPKESWQFNLESTTSISATRLLNDKLFVVTQRSINQTTPCPVVVGSRVSSVSIDCNEIYHPITPVPVDVTYTVLVFNPKTGEVANKVSFVGASNQSIVYMSPNFIYVTYSYYESIVTFYNRFLKENASDLLPETVLNKLTDLEKYDISDYSKYTEMQFVLESFYGSLDTSERKRVENEITNRLESYAKEHIREFVKTGLVKIDSSNLGIEASSDIPGTPLNQFSLDEHKGKLRVATTVAGGVFNVADSENDVYVLDEGLNITGNIQGLGLTERVYSVRFIEDKGYVVTFRQIDPFYVLDLSDSNRPKKVGELKIPGYSSYLHPIDKDNILGVGQEGANVKVSLFDVSDPSNPSEESKYDLDEFWTEVSRTHHAFLLDTKHKVFFMPAGSSGYVFSYEGNKLSLRKVVADISAQRAIFINDYLYVIGDLKIVVLNENDWSQVNELNF